MKSNIKKYFLNFNTYLILSIIFVLIASLQSYLAPLSLYKNGFEYTHYNNYVIFKQSFFHLIQNKDLYIHYPNEYWDLYKYSPTFSLLFSPLAILPDLPGLILWNILNALGVFLVFRHFPALSDKQRIYILWFVFLELFTCLQNEQSNGIIVGLTIGAFILLERKQTFWASLLIVFTVFIKLFGIVSFALFLLYPQKIKSAVYSLFWIIMLALLPAAIIPFSQLKFLYLSWWKLLVEDHTMWDGLSVMGWLNSWFDFHPDKLYTLLSGVIIFCLPFIRYRQYKYQLFRILILSSVLIWVVIFNHKAESPTFIIAISGVALWYFIKDKNIMSTILIILAFVLTILSPTDIFPPSLRLGLFKPYVIKAVPCIFIWFKIIYDAMVYKQKDGVLKVQDTVFSD